MHVRRRKNGKYQAIVRAKHTYLSRAFLDRKSCVAWGNQQEVILYRGGITEIPKNLTLKVLINEYLHEVVPYLKDTSLSHQLNRIIKRYGWLVNKPFENLKPSDFAKFKHERVLDCGNPNSKRNNFRAVNKDLNHMSIIINRAININLLPLTNHIKVIDRFPETDGLYRPIKRKEHKLLLEHANTTQKAIILLARHTGARPNEIHNIKWNNLDLETNELTIPWNINKSNRGRIIPIRPFLTKWLLKNLDKNSDFIIPLSKTAFRFWFMRKVKELKFKEFVFYHYRRNYVQYHADRNVPMPQLALWTGHSSLGQIARYYGLRLR